MSLKFMILVPVVLALLLTLSIHLLWGFTWLIGKIFHFGVSYGLCRWITICTVALAWLTLAYGYIFGRFQLDINQRSYESVTLPTSFHGYRIVHLSDIHLSTFNGHPDFLERLVDSVNSQQPDLICFTGDLVTIGVEEAQPFEDILKKLQAKDGVISVLGNHDFLIYRRDYKSNRERTAAVDELTNYERDVLGWKLLRNQSLKIARGADTITILGVDNYSCKDQGFHTVSYGDLDKAMSGTDGFRILLTHDPTHWRNQVVGQTNIPLTLSGHTHDAQFKIFGWSPSSRLFPEHAGWYHESSEDLTQSLYVNVGIGCTLPVRIGVNPEITVIDLFRKN